MEGEMVARRRMAIVAGVFGGGDRIGGGERGDTGTRAAANSGRPALGTSLPRGSEAVRLEPSSFPTEIDNRYLPLTPGDRRVSRVTDAEGLNQRNVSTGW
jgi:hypothetical protein